MNPKFELYSDKPSCKLNFFINIKLTQNETCDIRDYTVYEYISTCGACSGGSGAGTVLYHCFFHDNKQTDTVLIGASGVKAQLVNLRGFEQ